MIRKSILFLVFTALALSTVAQTQSGYVKTRGRMVNGKHVPGQGLVGATVQIKGRASVLVKNNNGSFSFPVNNNQFFIQSVKKNGYQLVDADAAPRAYSFSSAPIFLVMETPAQLMEDKLASERKLRRTLTSQLQKREDEIELLKEQNRITQEQYHIALQQLYDQQETNEKLISEMADYYSQIDYDQIDEFNRQVSEYIMAGELAKADSLLRSKGDIDERIRQLNEHRDANDQMRQKLEKSESVERLNREDLARDCFSFFRRFVLENEHDSALCYIQKRANLDTINGQWQTDAASYLLKRGLLQWASKYYDRALNSARQLAQDSPDAYRPLLAKTLNNMALLYSESPNNREAESLFQESLALFKSLSQDDAQNYSHLVASTLNNMAVYYSLSANQADKVEELLRESLAAYEALSAERRELYAPEMASVWNNLAILYDETDRHLDSEQAYKKALELYRQLSSNSSAFDADYAATLNNLSAFYFREGNHLYESQNLLNQALEIYRRLAVDDPQRYAPMLAVSLNNRSVQDFALNRKDDGEKSFVEALNIYRNLVDSSPRYYLPRLANGLYEQAIRYYQDGELEKSESLFRESLDAFRALAEVNEMQYLPEVAKLLRNLANVCDKQQNWLDAEELYQEELTINSSLAQNNPDEYNSHLARTYGNLSNHAILTRDFARAADYARRGLAIDDSRLFIQANLAAALLFMGQTGQAQDIYKKYRRELKQTFLDDFRQFENLGIIPAEARQAVESIKQIINRQ